MSRQIEGIFFDDIGSFPLPKGVRLNSLSRDQYLDLVRDVLAQKSRAGVEVPTYPQFRDMIRMFMDGIENPALTESPYLIKKEYAKIMELEAVPAGQDVRVCVTGPVERIFSITWRRAWPGSFAWHWRKERCLLRLWTSRALV
jgi:5-methyltetrahydropteroyltriglutamate--homocysteine methyltransferase